MKVTYQEIDSFARGPTPDPIRAAITAGRTSIIVAHRFSTLTGADRVMVLADGRIVEQGPPDEILKRHGR